LFREAGTGELHCFSVQANSGGASEVFLNSVKYSSATAFSALYSQAGYYPGGVIHLRIADDGVNRICSYSPDGQNWMTFHSIGRTDFLTADEVGFGANAENATYDLGVQLLSWKEA
jgi:hypothetical protein